MTFSALGEALAERWPQHPPAALAQGVRAHVPLVQVPPRAVWGRAGQSRHTSAEHWLGGQARTVPRFPETLPGLVTRYLAAFGPATGADVAAWSGLTGLRAVLEELRPSLVTFRDEQGAELFDLPSAPRPDQDTPAPVRLAAEFDNLLLAHADRTRVISAANLQRFYTINGIFPGSVLVDGFVAGMWRLARSQGRRPRWPSSCSAPSRVPTAIWWPPRPSGCSRSARRARPATSVSAHRLISRAAAVPVRAACGPARRRAE